MSTVSVIIIALLILVVFTNVAAIWLAKKGYTRDDNNNMIPDVLEEKFSSLKEEVSYRVDRVGEELKDVSNAIKEVGNQLSDIPKAASGKTRPGRKPKN